MLNHRMGVYICGLVAVYVWTSLNKLLEQEDLEALDTKPYNWNNSNRLR